MPSFQLHPGIAANSVSQHLTQPNLFVVGGGQHFGLAGSGRLYCTVLNNNANFSLVNGCTLPENVFSACFPDPTNPHVVAVAGGDGVKVVLTNTVQHQTGQLTQPPLFPQQPGHQHQTEVTCVKACSSLKMPLPGRFVSCGFDGTARVFQIGEGGQLHIIAAGLMQIPGYSLSPLAPKCFDASPHPGDPNIIATAFADGFWRVFDLRMTAATSPSPTTTRHSGVIAIGGHPQANGIVNSVDWSNFDPALLCIGTATGAVDLFDMRKHSSNANSANMIGSGVVMQQQQQQHGPVIALRGGHRAAVRRARFSPHSRNMILSCGFDFGVSLWDLDRPQSSSSQQQSQQPPFLAHRYEHHREPVHDLIWDIHRPGHVLSVGWDGLLVSWMIGHAPSFNPPQPLPMWPEPQRAVGAPMLVMRI